MTRKKSPPPPPDPEEELDDLEEEEEEIEETIETDDDAGDSITAPPYLKELIALPGIDANVLRGIDTGRAWIKIESRISGAATNMPLAHLAPDAIDVLGELGFDGLTTFEIRSAQNGNVLRYFACRLPELEEEEGDGAAATTGAGATTGDNSQLVRLIAAQQLQMTALAKKLNELSENPFAAIDRILPVVEKITKLGARLMPQGGGGGGFGLREVMGLLGEGIGMLRGDPDDGEEEDPDDGEDPEPEEVAP